MEQSTKSRYKAFMVLAVSVALTISVLAPLSGGDVLANGVIKMEQVYVPPSITVNLTNYTYQGATFVLYTYIYNNSTSGMLQVHLNFKLNGSTHFTTLLLNVLQVFNTGNLTGNFSMLIKQSAQAGANKTLNSTYTDTLKVYMKHGLQTPTDLGTYIQNNTEYLFPFYPFSNGTPMYYIGMNYTEPPTPPGSDINSVQQFVNFTLTAKA